jgi:hypothetical protein
MQFSVQVKYRFGSFQSINSATLQTARIFHSRENYRDFQHYYVEIHKKKEESKTATRLHVSYSILKRVLIVAIFNIEDVPYR